MIVRPFEVSGLAVRRGGTDRSWLRATQQRSAGLPGCFYRQVVLNRAYSWVAPAGETGPASVLWRFDDTGEEGSSIPDGNDDIRTAGGSPHCVHECVLHSPRIRTIRVHGMGFHLSTMEFFNSRGQGRKSLRSKDL